MPHFTRGLAEVGAEVYGLGHDPAESLAPEVRKYLTGYIRVPNLLDEESAVRHALPQLERLAPDRIECLWEVGVELAARLRQALGVVGQRPEDARAFRDKDLMKQRLEVAGLRVPRHAKVRTAAEVRAAAERIGYPLIVKPIDGAGTRDTHRVDDAAALEVVLRKVAHVPEMSVEEFIDGEEFTYDTVCIGGKVAFDSVAQYHPRPLLSRTQEWLSPAQIVLRDPHIPQLQDAVQFGRGVLAAMGMGTGFTHMEWYRKGNGEIVFGEIAARAPGGRLVDQMNFANDFDVYCEWARSVCWGAFEQVAARKFHVTCVFKRAVGQGRIQRISGLQEVKARLGGALVAVDLLPIGAQRRDWKQTLLSDGCLIARHEDYATTLRIQEMLIRDIQLTAG
jgi:hypothetical protein